MKIMIDQEAIQVLRQICDVALKGAGLGIIVQVNRLSACIQALPEVKPQPFPIPQPKEKTPEEVKEVAEEEQKEEQKEVAKTIETKEVVKEN
jgi:hypothetical protein